jgi:hypothetical protein
MTDLRFQKLAKLLVEYSTQLKKGDRVLLDMIDVPDEFSIELIRAARAVGVIGACLRFRVRCHSLVAGGVGAGCGGGLPISSMRPSATSSRAAITMVTTAIGRPQKTKITAASAKPADPGHAFV